MNAGRKSLVCLSSIHLDDPVIDTYRAKAKVTLHTSTNKKSSFLLEYKYQHPLSSSDLPLLRLACIMSLLNYGLFTQQFLFDFPLFQADISLVNHLNQVFSRDIFVNKIMRRKTNYILPEYLPKVETITAKDAEPTTVLQPQKVLPNTALSKEMDPSSCGVLSSGGKESLLTYGLLKEIGCKVYPYYINESGGHWRTALSAYRYHSQTDPNTQRIWTNVDRFYVFMLDNLPFIRSDHRKIWADTYPLRLCIFPVYIFILLPLFVKHHIGNILLGSEFDDLRFEPEHHGVNHYYGIYDQHQDYDDIMNQWYEQRIPGLVQWSAVRSISGLIVERILVNRYPHLASHQRSCHSCHFEGTNIVPCGTCSKCMGVLLFLLANNLDPRIMNFKENDIKLFHKRVTADNLRLDHDEQQQSFHLISKLGNKTSIKPITHVEQIHIHPKTCDPTKIPHHIRVPLYNILEQYTTGQCVLHDDQWVTNQIPLSRSSG